MVAGLPFVDKGVHVEGLLGRSVDARLAFAGCGTVGMMVLALAADIVDAPLCIQHIHDGNGDDTVVEFPESFEVVYTAVYGLGYVEGRKLLSFLPLVVAVEEYLKPVDGELLPACPTEFCITTSRSAMGTAALQDIVDKDDLRKIELLVLVHQHLVERLFILWCDVEFARLRFLLSGGFAMSKTLQ